MNLYLAAALAHLVQLFGGSLGAAILAFSLAARVALLPLTIRLARRAQRQQALARKLQPEIDALEQRFAQNPSRLFAEIRALHQRHGHRPLDFRVLLGSLLQLPLFGLLYRTIRDSLSANRAFLWIRNLAAPDLLLTLIVLALAAVSAWCVPALPAQARTMMVVIQVFFTAFLVWKLAAGLGLYWAASNLVGLFQTLWLRRPPVLEPAHA